MIRLGRVWKPCVFVVEKAVTERAVSDAFVLALGQDPLPPVEVLSCPRARHPRPSRRLSEGLASIAWLASPRASAGIERSVTPPGYCF